MPKRLIAVGLMLALVACASEPRRDFRHRGGPGERGAPGRAARQRLFISPSGEPFRGQDGLASWFAQADADHDGTLTPAEFQADAVRFFRYLDKNGDGVIDGLEIQAYERDTAPEIATNDFDRPQAAPEGGARGGGFPGGRRGGRRGGGMGGGRGASRSDMGGHGLTSLEGASRYALINEPEPVANADADLDGRVSLDEWRKAASRRFQTLDKAKTGRLTLDQLKGKAPSPPKPMR